MKTKIKTQTQKTLTKPIVVAIAIFLIAGIAVGAYLFTTKADKKTIAVGKPALTVNTVKPQMSELGIKLTANGSIAAWQETIVGAEVNGMRLNAVRVNVGDQVIRGQELATFAPEAVEAELAQQRASVAEAEASAAEAQSNAERARTLEASGALSAQQINQYLTAAKTADARVAAARAIANSAQIKLKNTRVLAPDSGVVSARTATVGAVVQSGQELFRLIRNNRLEWRAEVTAAELDKVRVGQTVALTTPGGKLVTGKVRMLAPTIDVQTRNTIVYVDLPKTDDARAGMFAKGEFALGQSSALTVPQQAVVVRDGFSYVFVIQPSADEKNNAQSRVAQSKVSTGRRAGERVEITEGLKADQLIVGAGAGFLNDGDLVGIAVGNPAVNPASAAKSSQNQTPASAGVSTANAATKPAQ